MIPKMDFISISFSKGKEERKRRQIFVKIQIVSETRCLKFIKQEMHTNGGLWIRLSRQSTAWGKWTEFEFKISLDGFQMHMPELHTYWKGGDRNILHLF